MKSKQHKITVSDELAACIQQEADKRGLSWSYVAAEKLAQVYDAPAQDNTWGRYTQGKQDE